MFATNDQTAKTIVNLIKNAIVPRHGVPRIILSDQGPAFTSELYASEKAALGSRITWSKPYHHQANGLVERWNQTLMSMIKLLTEMCKAEWDKWINPVLFAYRTAVNATTGDTSFFMMHGRDPDFCRVKIR